MAAGLVGFDMAIGEKMIRDRWSLKPMKAGLGWREEGIGMVGPGQVASASRTIGRPRRSML